MTIFYSFFSLSLAISRISFVQDLLFFSLFRMICWFSQSNDPKMKWVRRHFYLRLKSKHSILVRWVLEWTIYPSILKTMIIWFQFIVFSFDVVSICLSIYFLTYRYFSLLCPPVVLSVHPETSRQRRRRLLGIPFVHSMFVAVVRVTLLSIYPCILLSCCSSVDYFK